MLDVSIEDLTVVVLIHELSHGYTHLGRDIDGAQWDDSAFGKSARRSLRASPSSTRRLSPLHWDLAQGLPAAYGSLLKLQSGPYLAHQDWLKGDRWRRGETVRFALIAARSHGPTDYVAWRQLMDMTSRNLT